MPARLFTLVSLAMTFAGILLAILLVEANRPARSWEIGMVVPCIFEEGRICKPPLRK